MIQPKLSELPSGLSGGVEGGGWGEKQTRRKKTRNTVSCHYKGCDKPKPFLRVSLGLSDPFSFGFWGFFSPFNGQGLYVSLQIQGVMKLLHTSACICQRSLTSRGNES